MFRKLKEKQGEKGFCIRAIISSLIGELCDSCIFIPLGMNILPKLFLGFEFMTWEQIAIAIPAQALCKTLYESCIVPVTALVAKATKKYESTLSIENARAAKALNDEWSYKQMSEVIEITPHAFYNWLHGYYELSSRKLIELDSLINDLLAE